MIVLVVSASARGPVAVCVRTVARRSARSSPLVSQTAGKATVAAKTRKSNSQKQQQTSKPATTRTATSPAVAASAPKAPVSQVVASKPAAEQPAAVSRYSYAAMKQTAVDGWRQIKFGFSKLGRDTRGTFELWYKSYQGTKITKRRDIRLVDQTKRDWGKIVPFTLYSCLPGSFILLPVVIRIVPGLLPSGFLTPDFMEKMDKTLVQKREQNGPLIVQDLRRLSELVAKAAAEQANAADARTGTYYARLMEDLINSPADKRTYAQLVPLLPVFETQWHIGHLSYAQARQYATFIGAAFPFFMPKTRVLRHVTAVLKDDALIRREGIKSLREVGDDDVLETARERARDAELLVREHTRFTEHFGEAPAQRITFPLLQPAQGDYSRQALALIAARALEMKQYSSGRS
ncbi:hypothetical protein RI367_000466 [Sorochytrium milnesiophthora]